MQKNGLESSMVNLEDLAGAYEHLIVYGAGDYGNVAVKYIMSDTLLSYKLKAVAVSMHKRDDKDYLEGIPVLNIKRLTTYRESALVIIAVATEKQQEIRHTLKECGFKHVFSMSWLVYRDMKQKAHRNRIIAGSLNNLVTSVNNANEILWAMNFNRAISESKWIIRKDFAPNGMAVGNFYLYIMYKILDSGRFSSALDIGMGQTTKMIAQYANYDSRMKHLVIEDNQDWIDFISPSLHLRSNSEVCRLDYKMVDKGEYEVRVFAKFKEHLKDRKFDFISIDAPLGGDMKMYSRVDILEILPECLTESWIIMMDDVDRVGEQNTVKRIKEILQDNHIAFEYKEYMGQKKFAILTSYNNRFFCTV